MGASKESYGYMIDRDMQIRNDAKTILERMKVAEARVKELEKELAELKNDPLQK